MIGLVIIGIILVPIIILIAASVLETPRTLRIPGLFFGSLVLQIGGIILSFAILGTILGLIIPQ
jgi:hypothetical protein